MAPGNYSDDDDTGHAALPQLLRVERETRDGIRRLEKAVDRLEERVSEMSVRLALAIDNQKLVRQIVFGGCGMILIAVMAAVINYVVRK